MKPLMPLKQLPPLNLLNPKSPLNMLSTLADDPLIRSRRSGIWKSPSSSSSTTCPLPTKYMKRFILPSFKSTFSQPLQSQLFDVSIANSILKSIQQKDKKKFKKMKKQRRNDRTNRFPRKRPRAIEDVVTGKTSAVTLEMLWLLADCKNVFTGIENRGREHEGDSNAYCTPRGKRRVNLETATAVE